MLTNFLQSSPNFTKFLQISPNFSKVHQISPKFTKVWLNVKIPWLLTKVSLWRRRRRRTYGTIRLSRCAAGKNPEKIASVTSDHPCVIQGTGLGETGLLPDFSTAQLLDRCLHPVFRRPARQEVQQVSSAQLQVQQERRIWQEVSGRVRRNSRGHINASCGCHQFGWKRRHNREWEWERFVLE